MNKFWAITSIIYSFFCAFNALTACEVTNVNDSGAGSLRAAITCANTTTGATSITFNISSAAPHVIMLATQLPPIEDDTTIDANTQANDETIVLDGSALTGLEDGINIVGNNCEIYGLQIANFPDDGIYVAPNTSNITIGDANKGNTIINNGRLTTSGDGIYINSVSGITLRGNYIGTDVAFLTTLGNGNNGINISASTNVTIGGTAVGYTNIISGNSAKGINISNASSSISIMGNYIGTSNVFGSNNIGNGSAGISINNASNITIGGAVISASNTITNNSLEGITATTVNTMLVENNLLSGNGNRGLDMDACDDVTVVNNKIGISYSGAIAFGNSNEGIYANNTNNLVIGGSVAGQGNVIAGNNGAGIAINNATTNIQIKGNKIGTTENGLTAIANAGNGLFLLNANNVRIGGSISSESNIIAANQGSGISVVNSTSGVFIRGNNVGVGADGITVLPNLNNGISINGASNITIGGSASASGNLIAGNGGAGVAITNESNTITLLGNFIGTDHTGTLALGNTLSGILISNATNTSIGDTGSFEGNLISSNLGSGIEINQGADGVNIYNNVIGLNSNSDAALGNSNHGILVAEASMNVNIGGSAIIQANEIAYNVEGGINITESAVNCTMLRNRIYCNNNYGINLSDGANTDMLTPAITNHQPNTVVGTATPNASIDVYIYDDTGCTLAACQGKNYVGNTLANAAGNWVLAAPISEGTYVTATATLNNNTSQFAACYFLGTSTEIGITLPGNPTVTATTNIKVWLEGAYHTTNGEMTSTLNDAELIPNRQPYANNPWEYGGSELADNFSEEVTDWVLLQALDANYNVVESRATFILKNGLLSDNSTTAGVNFYQLNPAENYYFIIRHRNHLDIVSVNPLGLNNTSPHDFTNASNVDTSNSQLKDMGSGIFAMRGGDIDGNGVLTYTDFNNYTANISLSNTYTIADVNLDSIVDDLDYTLYFDNLNTIGINLIRY